MFKFVNLILLSWFFLSPVEAQLNVEALMKNVEKVAYYSGDDGRTQARMLIVDGQGRKQYRQFSILRKDTQDNGDQKLMVVFSQPSDVRNTVFRVEKHTNLTQTDGRWLYLPALDLVKRISAGDKRTSFVGSHFFYEDVSGRAVEEDNFQLLDDNAEQYVLKGIPKEPSSVEFSHYIVNIDKQTLLPMKIMFFDRGGKHYRTLETIQQSLVQGYPTVLRSKVSDLNSGGYTIMEFRQPEYNIGLPQGLFSERSLRQIPRKWLP